MVFTFSPPLFLFGILGAVLVVVIVSMFLKKGQIRQKIVTMVILVAVLGFIGFRFAKPITLTVDNQGLRYSNYGNTDIQWSEVESALVTSNLSETPYKPVLRTGGTAAGDLRTGWFKLENGEKAKLLMELPDQALIIRTDDGFFLFAPGDFTTFMAEVSKHVDIQQE